MHAWKKTSHPLVVLIDYNTFVLNPLDQVFNDLLNDQDRKAMFVRHPTGAVSTNMLIIKPSLEEYESVRNTYLNAFYTPYSGWNGEGHNGFPGELGLEGFLSYYYRDDNSIELDRCIFMNSFDPECKSTPFPDVCVAYHSPDVCGQPWECPEPNPLWDPQTEENCLKIHREYFQMRYEFEQYRWNKPKKKQQKRFGMFRRESFLGYCKDVGKDNYLKMTQNERAPKRHLICPPMVCPEGSYVSQDCDCVTDPCSACPEGTYCQETPEPMCLDCNCGFCDKDSAP